jgi:integrase
MRDLRHTYASTLLASGVDIRTLTEYLGHSAPGFTLRTYTHLMPSGEERTRAAEASEASPFNARRPGDRRTSCAPLVS